MWIRVGLQVSFLYVLMRQQVFPNRGLKVFETQTFCFLLDFINFFQDEREESKWGEGKKKTKQEGLKRFIKILKTSMQHLWCQSKSLWMKKQDMLLILARTLLTRRLSMQKVCPKATKSIAQLATIIKQICDSQYKPHHTLPNQPEKLMPCIHAQPANTPNQLTIIY